MTSQEAYENLCEAWYIAEERGESDVSFEDCIKALVPDDILGPIEAAVKKKNDEFQKRIDEQNKLYFEAGIFIRNSNGDYFLNWEFINGNPEGYKIALEKVIERAGS